MPFPYCGNRPLHLDNRHHFLHGRVFPSRPDTLSDIVSVREYLFSDPTAFVAVKALESPKWVASPKMQSRASVQGSYPIRRSFLKPDDHKNNLIGACGASFRELSKPHCCSVLPQIRNAGPQGPGKESVDCRSATFPIAKALAPPRVTVANPAHISARCCHLQLSGPETSTLLKHL